MKPKGRILIIEDNEQNRYLASYLLRHHGYEVVAAVGGKEGIDLLKTTTADLILLDIQLPDMDGYEIARVVRQNPATAHIPMVAVSSFAMPGDRERALGSGCDGYIEKPIDPARFVAQLQEFFPQQ